MSHVIVPLLHLAWDRAPIDPQFAASFDRLSRDGLITPPSSVETAWAALRHGADLNDFEANLQPFPGHPYMYVAAPVQEAILRDAGLGGLVVDSLSQ